MKKILTVLLALLMLASVCVIGAYADSYCPLDGWMKSEQGPITVKKADPSCVVKDGEIKEGEYEMLEIDRTDTDSPLHIVYMTSDNMREGLEMMETIEFYFSWDEVHGFNFAIKNKPARIQQLLDPDEGDLPKDDFATDNAYIINILTENGYEGTIDDNGYAHGTMDPANYCVYYALAKKTDDGGQYIEGHYGSDQLGLTGDYDPEPGTDYVINYTEDGWSIIEWSVPFKYIESGAVGAGSSIYASLTATAAGSDEDRYDNLYSDTYGIGLGDKCFMVDSHVDREGAFAQFVLSDTAIPAPVSSISFEDVPAGQYYYDAVAWAVANNITKGTDATHFSPKAGCTRAQVVTFLWRSAGEPEPTTKKNPFEDVDSNQYYYKAVLWAVEKGITNGTDKAHFSPKSTCTRGQIVTFLYRWKGSPKVEGAKNPFEDVKSGDFFYDAVLWAVANGITTGKNETHFAPKDTCTRAQVVTFMYRGK